jgi:hypothetical protein
MKTAAETKAEVQPGLRLEYRDPAELAENPANWRTHPQKQITALADVIAEVGWAGACLYNERTGRLIDGHARRKGAIERGEKVVPVLIGNWTEEQERTILATLDPLSAMAEMDPRKFEALLDGITASTPAIESMLAELKDQADAAMWEVVVGQTDPDAVPEPPDEAITQPGDLWLLGKHRLLCGDASKPADVDRLVDGAPIHLVNTDPPYNVRVEPRSNNAIAAGLSSFTGTTHHQQLDVERHPDKAQPTTRKLRAKDRPLLNDFVTDEEFNRLLDAWFGNIGRVLLPGHIFVCWAGYANLGNYPPFLKKHGLYFSQAICWDNGQAS